MTHYDETTPQVWKVPLRDTLVPDTVALAPKAGYLVPVAYAPVAWRWLQAHGIEFHQIDHPLDMAVEQFHADSARFAPTSVEGHQRLALKGEWQAVHATLGPGALFVPVAQPLARLLVQVLEPEAPDSMAAWGVFNNAFERKEYMEAYVAEDVARDMLAKDPALKARFERKLEEDPEFAASPRARLEFFHRLHRSWDSGYERYPVLRTDASPL